MSQDGAIPSRSDINVLERAVSDADHDLKRVQDILQNATNKLQQAKIARFKMLLADQKTVETFLVLTDIYDDTGSQTSYITTHYSFFGPVPVAFVDAKKVELRGTGSVKFDGLETSMSKEAVHAFITKVEGDGAASRSGPKCTPPVHITYQH